MNREDWDRSINGAAPYRYRISEDAIQRTSSLRLLEDGRSQVTVLKSQLHLEGVISGRNKKE